MTDHHHSRPTTNLPHSYVQFILLPLPLPRLLTRPRRPLLHTAVVAINFCLTRLLGCIASFRPSDTGLIFELSQPLDWAHALTCRPACLPACLGARHHTSHNNSLTGEKNSTRKGPELQSRGCCPPSAHPPNYLMPRLRSGYYTVTVTPQSRCAVASSLFATQDRNSNAASPLQDHDP
jgi:hypothetical protein